MMKKKIIEISDSPSELEALYRSNPKEFIKSFPDVFAQRSDSAILCVWNERLFFEASEAKAAGSISQWRLFDILVTVILSLLAGLLVKLPYFISALDEERFYSRNLGFIVIGALMIYFFVQKKCERKAIIVLLFLLALLYMNFLPDRSGSQTVGLSFLHMPFFLWSLLGAVFLRGSWRDLSGRLDYVRYNGELLIYSTVILIGGAVLTGLTFALFELIGVSIENWYMETVVVCGTVASPIVATLLVDRIIGERFKIAPLLAKVFTPLFLVTVVAYLLVMIVSRESPFTDREFLMAFNGLLLVVLGLCVFSISGRGAKETISVTDIMNISLVSVTLLVDVIALVAIIFRLTSYGLSPNRLVVLGANLLVFGHLAGILYHYMRFSFRVGSFQSIEKWIAVYMPSYAVWSAFVAVGFPLIFWFR